MEQQQGDPRPPFPPENYGKRMWQLWGPILIKWGIEFLVSIVAMTFLAMAYQFADPEAFLEALDSEEAMIRLYDQLITRFLEAGTLIQGATSLVIIPVMWIFFHRDRVKEKMYGVIPNKKAPAWKYAAVVLMSLALCLGLNNLINIGNLVVVDEVYAETMEAMYSAAFPLQVLCLGVLVPISEELLFRGLLFRRLRERGTFLQAAFYSAVVFGLMHMNMVQMIYGFILGMMLAYVYEKYGSVKAPVLAHATMNLLSVTATQIGLMDWLMADIMRIGTVTVLCASVAASMFVFMQRIDEKPDLPGKNDNNDEKLTAF
ncbi:type II CAAX endopeptidase family protein [uncultured Merdimonas sp.]|uniref:CPBP family intramembrane glutamic endopeptidase n=1 Tax=uncultured Merdimonas sp. TaxID=2023269 RepID=UPI0032079A09